MLVFAVIADEPQVRTQRIEIEDSLILRIAAEEKEAFIRLYDKAYRAVYAYALSLLHSHADAEDAAQETFLKVHGAAHLYKPQGKAMAWIMTITRNICMMHFREKKHDQATDTEETGEENYGFADRHFEDAEDRMVLETALRVLSEEECAIVMLHAVSGLKHREIGEVLKMPLSTVLSKYNRSIRKLRMQLEMKA